MSNLDQNEMAAYEASQKIARDNYSHDETVRKEEKRELASKLIAQGWTMKEVVKFTGLSAEEIDALDSYTGNLDEEEMAAYLKIARDNYSHDETIRNEARREGFLTAKSEGFLVGKLEGLLEGKVKGKREQLLETARGMKNENLPVELIAKLTNLTVEEINSL